MTGSWATRRAKSERLVLIPKQLRLEWVDLMALDASLSPIASRIANIIGYHVNKYTGHAFLTQALIAKLSGRCERTVFQATKELEASGYLIVKRREFGTIIRKTKSGRDVVVRLAGGKGVANMYFPACDGSPVSASNRSIKLAERCELIRNQRSQKIAAKAAADCDPTLSPPTEENPSTERERKGADGLGRLGEVIRCTLREGEYRSWFGKAKIFDETSTVITLAVPNRFHCYSIKKDFGKHFGLWCQALGKEKIELVDASTAEHAARLARQREDSS